MTQPNEEDGERNTKVVKSSIVTALSSTALGTLRKQTWKNKCISFKSFLFQSFQLAGQFVSLNTCHYCPVCSFTLVRPMCFLSFVWLADFYFCAYAQTPLPSLCQSMFIISFKSSIKLLFFRRCGANSMIPGDGELGFNAWLYRSLPEWVWTSLLNSPNLSFLTHRMNNTQHAVFCMDYTT